MDAYINKNDDNNCCAKPCQDNTNMIIFGNELKIENRFLIHSKGNL